MRHAASTLAAAAFACSLCSCVSSRSDPSSGTPHAQVPAHSSSTVPLYGYRVVRAFPHDREAFTQGFTYANGYFYEGTGLNKASSIRQVEVETGEVLRSRPLLERYFGEGIAVRENRLVQLTYTSRCGFIYRTDTFDSLGTFEYDTEGWGITHDGRRFIMSDGSPVLRMLDPETMQVVDSLHVKNGDTPVPGLNELEFVQGEIYANVWPSFFIVRIDPRTGRVIGLIDLRGILPPEELHRVDVLNGIAYDPLEDRLFVTGKFWPVILEIELVLRR